MSLLPREPYSKVEECPNNRLFCVVNLNKSFRKLSIEFFFMLSCAYLNRHCCYIFQSRKYINHFCNPCVRLWQKCSRHLRFNSYVLRPHTSSTGGFWGARILTNVGNNRQTYLYGKEFPFSTYSERYCNCISYCSEYIVSISYYISVRKFTNLFSVFGVFPCI